MAVLLNFVEMVYLCSYESPRACGSGSAQISIFLHHFFLKIQKTQARR